MMYSFFLSHFGSQTTCHARSCRGGRVIPSVHACLVSRDGSSRPTRSLSFLHVQWRCSTTVHTLCLCFSLPPALVEDQFRFTGEIDFVRNREEADAAALKLNSAKVVGLDMEWHTPRVRGIFPSKTSLIQICSGADYCALFSMTHFDEMPASLRDLLQNGDVKKVRPKCLACRSSAQFSHS